MDCKCIVCDECGGTGNIWVTHSGEYLGKSRQDDQDELDVCEECCGTGIEIECDECRMAREEREYEEDLKTCQHCGRTLQGE